MLTDQGHLGRISFELSQDIQFKLLHPSWINQDSDVHCRPQPRPLSWWRTVYEASRGQSGCYLSLSSPTPQSDPTSCRERSDLAAICIGDLKTGLLQCSTGRSATGDCHATTASSTWQLTWSSSWALLNMLHCVCYSCAQFSMECVYVSVKHYWTNQCRLEVVRPSFNIVNWLHTTMAAEQVQQACILVRRTLHVERCARSACHFWLQKTA